MSGSAQKSARRGVHSRGVMLSRGRWDQILDLISGKPLGELDSRDYAIIDLIGFVEGVAEATVGGLASEASVVIEKRDNDTLDARADEATKLRIEREEKRQQEMKEKMLAVAKLKTDTGFFIPDDRDFTNWDYTSVIKRP